MFLLNFTVNIMETRKKKQHQNPAQRPFGDPFLLKASDDKYYMYGTGGVSNGFKVYSSDDLVTWTDEGPIYQGGTPDLQYRLLWHLSK